jgi:type IV secretory pathway VirB10-like protein
MNTFWLKIAALVVLVLALIVVVNVFLSSEPEPRGQPQSAPEPNRVGRVELRIQAEAKEPREARPSRRPKPETKPAEPEQPETLEEAEELNPHAENLYQMALVESKIAKKPFMTYKRMVDYCRQILQQYPNSPQAPKARQLLREMPERERKLYNVTDEEMGL